MELHQIEQVMRQHSSPRDRGALDCWLNSATLSRFRDWVPSPGLGETTLMDVGCYRPSIGYYLALGWQSIIGIAKEEGECNENGRYPTETGATARNIIIDVETRGIPEPDGSVDVVLMMEVIEHFGLDPMHALIEVNRVLKQGATLVLSTPNAAAIDNVYRIAVGRTPFTGLQFSGFSTNRHNRIYDCDELREVLETAGFEVEICTSRSYHSRARRVEVLRVVIECCDLFTRWWTGRQIERGEYLFVTARKRRAPTERFPRLLYFDEAEWPEWFCTIKQSAIKQSSRACAGSGDG